VALGRWNGAISFTANQEIQRANFFVLLEIWNNAASRQAFENLPQITALLARIQRLPEAPLDVRPGTLIELCRLPAWSHCGVPDQKRTQGIETCGRSNACCNFRWTLPLTVAACLMCAPAHADGFAEVVIVTPVDVDPQFVGQAEPLLEMFVEDNRKDRGVKSFILITQDPTPNHFQPIEVFRDMRAFDAHVSAPHTVTFRANPQPFIGAPYDERLYRAE